jgi:organic radical activating enzyme
MKAYFSINVTNKCNKACDYCVNIDYVNKKEYPDIIDFANLRGWLENEINEDDIVEIAGTGEPTLCEWLPDLMSYLDGKRAWAILRTNGFRLGEWRKVLGRLLVVMSRHGSGDDYVKEKCKFLMPHDLIMDRMEEETVQGKSNHASRFKNDELSPHKTHDIKWAFFVTPDGKVRFMPCQPHSMGTVWDYKAENWTCATFSICPFVLGAYNLVEYLKAPFEITDGYCHARASKFQQR